MSDYKIGYLVGLAFGGFVSWRLTLLFCKAKLHREKMKFMENFVNEIKALFEPKKGEVK